MAGNNNALSKYLVYTCWERMGTHGGIIAGSSLHDFLINDEDEAKAAVALVTARSKEFDAAFPSLDTFSSKRVVYIKNQPEWWTSR